MSDKQARNFLGVLYPDSESYDCQKVLSRIEDTFVDFAYIVHDMDVNENGEIKKAHIHWCGKKSSPAPLSTISNALGVEANNIEFCKNWKYSLRYLIHADNPDKFQYDLEKVTANFAYRAVVENRISDMMAKKILNYILEKRPPTMIALMDWCIENGCWSEFRRCSSTWATCIREVNQDLGRKNMEV